MTVPGPSGPALDPGRGAKPSGQDQEPRTWTIYVCPEHGEVPHLEVDGEGRHRSALGSCWAECEFVEVVERAALSRVEEERDRLREALKEAADDLGKAANQFASLHESQQHGHRPDIRTNHHVFAEKELKARAALSRSGGRQ